MGRPRTRSGLRPIESSCGELAETPQNEQRLRHPVKDTAALPLVRGVLFRVAASRFAAPQSCPRLRPIHSDCGDPNREAATRGGIAVNYLESRCIGWRHRNSARDRGVLPEKPQPGLGSRRIDWSRGEVVRDAAISIGIAVSWLGSRRIACEAATWTGIAAK